MPWCHRRGSSPRGGPGWRSSAFKMSTGITTSGRMTPTCSSQTIDKPAALASCIEVKCKFVRMWPHAHRRDFRLALVLDPRLDHVLGEDAAMQQELVVAFQ